MLLTSRRCAVFTLTLLSGPVLLAGCGGSGSGSGSSTSHIRTVDAAPNTGTSNIIVNGEAPAGDQQYFQYNNSASQEASPYYYIQPQNGVSFTYTAGVSLASGSQTGTTNADISANQYYTAFLIGRPDIYNSSPYDPRFMEVVVPAQRANGVSGQGTLRILNAAPDAGFTTTPATGTITAYNRGAITVTIGSGSNVATFSSITYQNASDYQTLPTGSNIPVTVAITGGATIETGTISLSGNSVYTLVIAEPTVPNGSTPAGYDMHLISE
jgi:hypothetical protein